MTARSMGNVGGVVPLGGFWSVHHFAAVELWERETMGLRKRKTEGRIHDCEGHGSTRTWLANEGRRRYEGLRKLMVTGRWSTQNPPAPEPTGDEVWKFRRKRSRRQQGGARQQQDRPIQQCNITRIEFLLWRSTHGAAEECSRKHRIHVCSVGAGARGGWPRGEGITADGASTQWAAVPMESRDPCGERMAWSLACLVLLLDAVCGGVMRTVRTRCRQYHAASIAAVQWTTGACMEGGT